MGAALYFDVYLQSFGTSITRILGCSTEIYSKPLPSQKPHQNLNVTH
jgi:hypothetical protein